MMRKRRKVSFHLKSPTWIGSLLLGAILAAAVMLSAIFILTSHASAKQGAEAGVPNGISSQTCIFGNNCVFQGNWQYSGPVVNIIDDSQSESLTLRSSQPDSVQHGMPHYSELKICIFNGMPCQNHEPGVSLAMGSILSMIENGPVDRTSVRIRLDKEPPTSQIWQVDSDATTLSPPNSKELLLQLFHHKTLVVEYSYIKQPPSIVSFDLEGLGAVVQAHKLNALAQWVHSQPEPSVTPASASAQVLPIKP